MTDNQGNAPAAGTLAADPAFATFDADTQGAFKNHGWDQKPTAEAAALALKSFREAEKFIGIPKEQIVRLPKDAADVEGIKAYRARIGVPNEAKEYDFAGVKFADGTELDAAFRDALAASFVNRGIPKSEAPELVKDFVKYLDDKRAGDQTIEQGKMAAEADELTKNWGPNMKANTFIANQAAEKLGFGKDVLETLAKTLGRVPMANALLKMGQMMGEDKFVANSSSGTPGIATKEQAQAKLADLQRDTAWLNRFMSGDARAKAEFDGLTRMLAA